MILLRTAVKVSHSVKNYSLEHLLAKVRAVRSFNFWHTLKREKWFGTRPNTEYQPNQFTKRKPLMYGSRKPYMCTSCSSCTSSRASVVSVNRHWCASPVLVKYTDSILFVVTKAQHKVHAHSFKQWYITVWHNWWQRTNFIQIYVLARRRKHIRGAERGGECVFRGFGANSMVK